MTSNSILRSLVACVALGAIGCGLSADVEKVPVGTDLQLTRQDGGVVEGKLTEKDAESVTIVAGKTTRLVPRREIADVRIVDGAKPIELPAMAKFREYTVADGTPLKLTMATTVSSETSHVEDAVEAKLDDAVRVDGVEVVPAGSVLHGTVTSAESAGKVKGRASLALHFTDIIVRGDRVPISARWGLEAASTKGDDAKKIGIGAGAGAIIGGIIGGKKGLATGAAVGGGAGTAMALTSEGKPVVLGAGADITTRLASPVDVRVPVR